MRNALYICLLLLLSCSRAYHIESHTANLYNVNNTVGTDTSFTRFLQPYKHQLDSQLNVVIGYTDTTLCKAQPECTLGNFIADAMLNAARQQQADVELAVFNYGGMRIPYINAGDIRISKVYELMPFDNALVILQVPGSVLQTWCNHMAARGGWPVSGMQIAMKDKQAKQIMINGKTIDPNRVYKVATNDYVASGGDNCSFLKTLQPVHCSVMIRDVLIARIRELGKAQQPLHPYIEKRVWYAE